MLSIPIIKPPETLSFVDLKKKTKKHLDLILELCLCST